MFSKIEINGIIEVKTGMHIGGSSAFAAIGAVDSPVIRDTLTDMPIIPGSSLKGKMRTLLTKKYSNAMPPQCAEEDDERIKRLFGSGGKNASASRVLFSDMMLYNMEEIRKYGLTSATEIKFENTINRLTAVANPRQIERVIRGSQFQFSVIYNVVKEEEILEDMKILSDGFKLMEYDYIGGHGSRGYGKIEFQNINVKTVIGDIKDDILNQCVELFKEV
ncbi:type III-A CRISPR-associated RAMP protein Csm3 [Clostridium sp. MD294]|uniref:type III-A CRISPR-associated RAMP protein Csm3 n=1 Tax=Clostridium sp. MD294 TaxID=97138 RepID=UPI0002CA6973|nr:type III-A CRISPR-associated RAMP protein Csm3 [Clostridium sp. MD294]NDO45314.1 type III-A CRISPR-associated RAMP protein Csm3 [Clostridium sp. MD294]USF31049.1 CRISPR system Cms endoribonuclease Csm3 [Clostridium sp. MD294]